MFCLPLLLGCQRLNYDKTVTVEPRGSYKISWDPPRYDQKLTVTISSPGSAVSAYLVKEADQDKAETALLNGKAPASPLAAKEKAEEITLEATIPAQTGFTLLLTSNKTAQVRVKVVGR